MSDKPATEETYKQAWKQEIARGTTAGKLIQTNGRADIKTVSVPADSAEWRQSGEAE